MAKVTLDNLLNGKQGKFWNYGNNKKDDYMPELTGTLVKISIAQQHEYGKPGVLMYWQDGNPMILIRLHIRIPNGETFMFDIKPKSTMWFEDIQPACPQGSLSNVLGNLIKLSYLGLVQATGRSVNRNKFQLQILGPGQFPSEGFDDTMPPTRNEAAGQQAQPQQQASPQQYAARNMVTPQQQAQGMYMQQQATMPPQLQQAMGQAQAASMANTAYQQAAYPQQAVDPMPVPPAPNQVPVEIYDDPDMPF